MNDNQQEYKRLCAEMKLLVGKNQYDYAHNQCVKSAVKYGSNLNDLIKEFNKQYHQQTKDQTRNYKCYIDQNVRNARNRTPIK